MTSLASVKGPSMMASLPPASRTRAPAALGRSPPVATSVPARTPFSPSFAIASMRPAGGGPDPSFDLTIVRNRISNSFHIGVGESPRTDGESRPHLDDEQGARISTRREPLTGRGDAP